MAAVAGVLARPAPVDDRPDRWGHDLALRRAGSVRGAVYDRKYHRMGVGLGVEVPVWGRLILGTLVQYRNANSNVAAFSYRDLSFSAGPMIRF